MNELYAPSDKLMWHFMFLLVASMLVFRTWLSEGLPGGSAGLPLSVAGGATARACPSCLQGSRLPSRLLTAAMQAWR